MRVKSKSVEEKKKWGKKKWGNSIEFRPGSKSADAPSSRRSKPKWHDLARVSEVNRNRVRERLRGWRGDLGDRLREHARLCI